MRDMIVNTVSSGASHAVLADTRGRDDGTVAVDGKKNILNESAAYPSQFGIAIAELYSRNYDNIKAAARASRSEMLAKVDPNVVLNSLWSPLKGDDAWHDAKLEGVLDLARALANRS